MSYKLGFHDPRPRYVYVHKFMYQIQTTFQSDAELIYYFKLVHMCMFEIQTIVQLNEKHCTPLQILSPDCVRWFYSLALRLHHAMRMRMCTCECVCRVSMPW